MKKLILVGAPPACGKNYVSDLICNKIKRVAYIDKDDLGDIIRRCFTLCKKELDMDGDFYKDNIRSVEYDTIIKLAFSALRYEDFALVNAPFISQVRDLEYMRALKNRANEINAELILVWVTASKQVCYERMKERNSIRDTIKLSNWDEYVKKINYDTPICLKEQGVVDELIVFDNENEITAKNSLENTIKILIGEKC